MNKEQYKQEVEETTRAYQYVLATRDVTVEEVEFLTGVDVSKVAKKETTAEEILEALQIACDTMNNLVKEVAKACGTECTEPEEASIKALTDTLEKSAKELQGDVGGITMYFIEIALVCKKMKSKLSIHEVLQAYSK